MARIDLKNRHNIEGSLYVDTTCIDCETCFHIAPHIFKEDNNLSIVVQQPKSREEWSAAKEAILSCPTSSIGVNAPPDEFKNAPLTFPRHITDTIYYCGYTSVDSYGATSYLIQSTEGNILIDSPRFNTQLVKEIEKLGGVKWMFLSHKDDVADHQKFHDHFKCIRIIHAEEVEANTENCELILSGQENFNLTSEVEIINTPGHTRGHLVLYYKKQFLFTGDHLFIDKDNNKVYASKNVNWYSWSKQLISIKKLLDLNVDWIFPGHGGWSHIGSTAYKADLQNILSS